MQVCRESRIETQRISKPLSTWLIDASLRVALGPSWSRAQELEAREMRASEEPLQIITPFNTDFDLLYLSSYSIGLSSFKSGPPNHDDVFQVALDPEVPLLLDAELFNHWKNPRDGFDEIPNGIEALYHYYLKPRKHVYLEVRSWPAFVLTEKGWQKAIQEGLFAGDRCERRLVPTEDVPLIRKYEALRHYSIPHTKKSRRPNWDKYLWTGNPNPRLPASRAGVSTAQLFMLQIADFLMWSRGLGDEKGEEIMDLNGQFKRDHLFVQQEGLKMPDFTAVIIFCAAPPPKNDQQCLYKHIQKMRPKYPEEDSSRLRLFMRRQLNTLLGRWGRSL
ncbi:hypothetical protein DHEL01_v206250 [Diaporthe helianthi]|uniref:Uncharacterized protein n=1 Tax=Diaporthe helianthi TaxID=158607 RepID=A0A2P5HYL9_DIAHE|nr:hypothetical protein DHEL01_v206250 [Diaporthe helianthi]